MRIGLTLALMLALYGCSGERAQSLPTDPNPFAPSGPPLTFVWVLVVPAEGSGECILDATVEIVRGHGIGRSLTQRSERCSYWDPDYDAVFREVVSEQLLTLRASAAGYVAKEITLVPTVGPQMPVVFELSRNS